jgi:hypothetical protein
MLSSVPATGSERRRLWLLALLVLVAHLALLQVAGGRLSLPGTGRIEPVRLTTRTVEAAPAKPAPAPEPVQAAAPAPTPPPATRAAAEPPAEPPVATQAEPTQPAEATPTAPTPARAMPHEEPPAATLPGALPLAAPPPPKVIDRAGPVKPAQAGAAPVSVPASARLGYDVLAQSKGLSYKARAELLWQQDGTRYDARIEISAFLMGSRVQTSSGELSAEGLAPTRFADKTRSEQAAHFERDKGRISFSANTPDAVLEPGSQDRLSVFLQLGALLAGDPTRYPSGSSISLPTAGTREAELWTFNVEGTEAVSTAQGDMQAVRLVRLPRREFDQKVEVWLAPSQFYLPIRIKLTQANGDFVDQVLRTNEKP